MCSSDLFPSHDTGTTTDLDGKFTLTGENGQTLVFSYIGMTLQEIVYKGKPLHVIMKDDSKALEEVVIIGYQTVKKSDLTGAVAVVDTKEMKKSSAGTLVSQMQGLATGVNVRSSGRAGEDASIQIRGVGSLSNNAPLWVVDGMITDPGVDFNPADVESIQILEDASAAAIYDNADNSKISGAADRTDRNRYKIGLNLSSKVNDYVKFNSRFIVGGDNNTYGWATTDAKKGGGDAKADVSLSQAYFGLTAIPNTVVNIGKQGLTTPYTVATDINGNEQAGTGILALSNVGPVTFGAGYFNNTNLEDSTELNIGLGLPNVALDGGAVSLS